MVLGIQGEGLFIFRDLGENGHLFSGIWGESGVLGSRGLRKNILGSWGERSFFFQGAKTPPPPLRGPHLLQWKGLRTFPINVCKHKIYFRYPLRMSSYATPPTGGGGSDCF